MIIKKYPHFALHKLKLDDNEFRKSVYAILLETGFSEINTCRQTVRRLSSAEQLKNM